MTKSIYPVLIIGMFTTFNVLAEDAYKNIEKKEQLISVHQNALSHAMELLKDKNPTAEDVLKIAKQFEDYILADERKAIAPDNEMKEISQVSSEVSNFNLSGLSIGINGQLKSTSAKAKYDTYTFDGVGLQNLIGNITADYEFKFNDRYALLVGGTVDLSGSEILKINGSYSGQTSREFKVIEKNHYSLFIAPSYQISNDTLGYVKFAYHHSKVDSQNNIGYSKGNMGIHGYGVGAGIRSQIYNNIYANLEVQRVLYNTESIISTDLGTGTTIGSFGLSYNFANNKNIVFDNSNVKFNGLSVGVSGLLKSSSIKTSWAGAALDSVGQQNIGAGIFADYAFRLSDRSLVLVGGTYDIKDTDIVKIAGYGYEMKIREKNHYSLFIAPSYQISNDTLGYVKFAHHHSKVEETNNLSTQYTYSRDVSGYGVGVGIRTYILDNLYANFEVQRVIYGTENISPAALDVESTIGSLGLSYNF